MSKIVWDIQLTNWEQDTPYLWSAGSFSSWQGLDIRKEPPFVRLSSKMTTEWTFDDNICFMKNLEDFWLSGILVCLENGKIYLDWTLKTTLNTGTIAHNRVRGVGYIWDVSWTWYLYYVTEIESGWFTAKIHRSTENLWTFTVWHKTLTLQNNRFINKNVPIISETTRLVIGIRDKIFELDNAETVTTLFTLWKYEEIVWITEFQNNYKIYTSVQTTNVFASWMQYFWDWTSDAFDYRVPWVNLPILWVQNNWPYDYVITGQSNTYSDLYLVSWSQRQELRVNLEDSTSAREFSKYMSIRWDILYISGRNKEGKYGIYSYGNYFPWFSKSLTLEYILDSWTDNFLFQCGTNTKLYIACTDDKVYSITYSNSWQSYVTSGQVITGKWVWNWLHTTKNVEYMWVPYKMSWTGAKIEIFLSKTWTFWATPFKTITDTSVKWVRIDANEFQARDLWDFYELQMKVVIYSSTDTLSTPSLWRMLLFCNDNLNL